MRALGYGSTLLIGMLLIGCSGEPDYMKRPPKPVVGWVTVQVPGMT